MGSRTGLNGFEERKSLIPHYQGSNSGTSIPLRVLSPIYDNLKPVIDSHWTV